MHSLAQSVLVGMQEEIEVLNSVYIGSPKRPFVENKLSDNMTYEWEPHCRDELQAARAQMPLSGPRSFGVVCGMLITMYLTEWTGFLVSLWCSLHKYSPLDNVEAGLLRASLSLLLWAVHCIDDYKALWTTVSRECA